MNHSGSRVRPALTALGRRTAGLLGGEASRWFGSRAGDAFGILTYHRIAPWHGPEPRPTWNVPPRRFRTQLNGLLRLGYQPWPLRRVLDYSREGLPIPPRTFVVTFDDGYENVYTHAWPMLRQLGIPATIFVATAYLDSPNAFPFDDWPGAGAPTIPADVWRPMTTAQCDELLHSGLIDIGTHTHSHANFRDRPDALNQDLLDSLHVLRSRLGREEVPFAFPFGIAEAALRAASKRAGVVCSLSTETVLVRPGSDPFTWGRFGVDETDTADTLAARLDGWYGLARDVWQQVRQLCASVGGRKEIAG
jgi:peptidoglycan/xylan/chitin deacetylase (PgdA/CDA1 family)